MHNTTNKNADGTVWPQGALVITVKTIRHASASQSLEHARTIQIDTPEPKGKAHQAAAGFWQSTGSQFHHHHPFSRRFSLSFQFPCISPPTPSPYFVLSFVVVFLFIVVVVVGGSGSEKNTLSFTFTTPLRLNLNKP